jgi:hypothetical protein
MSPDHSNLSIVPQLVQFLSLAKETDVENIAKDWERLPFCTDLEKCIDSDPVYFCFKVLERCDGHQVKSFPFLGEFMMKMLILPYSSACAARAFSTTNLNKTKLRNKLGFTTLNAVLGAKRFVSKDWKPPMSMVSHPNWRNTGKRYIISAIVSAAMASDLNSDI